MPDLPPATLRLEYRLESPDRLAILWSTRTASGRVSRPLAAPDLASIAALARALSRPDEAGWRPLSDRVAGLLLSGLEPPGDIRRLIVSLPEAGPLRAIPFEALGAPPLVERFAVWYEAPATRAAELANLWPAPPETSILFRRRYEAELAKGLAAAEALRRVKLEWLRTGGAQAHPYYWAGFVLYGDGAGATAPVVIPMVWGAGFGLLFASAAFLVWWRRKRFELL